MTSDGHGPQVQELFLQAARLPSKDRERWLRDRCAGDEQLLADVRSLLRYDNLPHDPLESGPFSVGSLPPALQDKQALPAVPGYRIVREIGTGGQAIVYEAVQESTTQRVALKVLRWGTMASEQERERLRREVLILARLKHPGIVSIIDSGETKAGVFFIATQFVDGLSLDEFTSSKHVHCAEMTSKGELGNVLRLFMKICTAIDSAHRTGVVHRDLKPANILVDRGGEPHVLDFGLAKPGLHDSLDTPDEVALTRSGQFMGSLPWASPEQAEGTLVDVRSDVYSLGVILYQLVSGGRFPYDVSGNMREVITKIMHADPTPLTPTSQAETASRKNVLPTVPLVDDELNTIVLKALAKSPDDRYQSAGELSAALNHFCRQRDEGLPSHEAATVAGQRQGVTLSLWLTTTALLAVVAIVVGYASKGWVFPAGKMSASSGGRSENPETVEAWRDIEFGNAEEDGNSSTELAFPAVSARTLAIRGTFPNEAGQPVTVGLRSTNGMYLKLVWGNNGEVRLSAPESTAPEAKAQVPEDAKEFVMAVLPNRCLVGTDEKWLLQLHLDTSGDWYPTLERRSDSVGEQRLQYLLVSELGLGSIPRLPADEMAAIECLIAADGCATSAPGGEPRNLFQIREIKAFGKSMELRGAELIARCQSLTRLSLTDVDEQAIRHLANLTRLEHLSIWNSTLRAGTLEQFQLEQLESLDLWHTDLEQPDFSSLAESESLEYVGIPNIAVTDENLRQLARVKSLKNLYVNGRFVTAHGIQSLEGLPQLVQLELSKARLSEQYIASLARIKQIVWLSLRDGDSSNLDIEAFSRFQHLHTLVLDGCKISPDGLRRLARLLPNCQISSTSD